jgi:hypothetical protein
VAEDDQQRAKWRAEFESLGYETVRANIANGLRLVGPLEKQKCAQDWLREKEKEREWRIIWQARIAWAALGISVLSLVVAVVALFK